MIAYSTSTLPEPAPNPAFRKPSFCEEVRLRYAATYPELFSLSNLEGKHLRLEMAAAGCEWSMKAGSEKEALFRGALAIQMVHEASLFHDDIIDQADMRRGRKTLFRERGSGASLIAGD
ncbi:MAG: polyprenyl synthetase family protein, partial [Spirochaetia bacterium]|nr:polyprenyl synthetase family protein [Spirochaetia bacterium]